jgi:hypothetical protein
MYCRVNLQGELAPRSGGRDSREGDGEPTLASSLRGRRLTLPAEVAEARGMFNCLPPIRDTTLRGKGAGMAHAIPWYGPETDQKAPKPPKGQAHAIGRLLKRLSRRLVASLRSASPPPAVASLAPLAHSGSVTRGAQPRLRPAQLPPSPRSSRLP